jgi:hypothetical protein
VAGESQATAPSDGNTNQSNNMPFGLQVIGSHGVVQIDETYANLALRAQGSLSVPGLSGASVVVSGLEMPIICIRNTGGVHVHISSDQAVPNVTYTMRSKSATTVQWFVFDKTAPAATGYGLNVYKDDGSLTYSTDWKVMRIGAIGDVPNQADAYTMSYGSLTAPYAATWAACLTSSRLVSSGGSVQQILFGDGIVGADAGASTDYISIGTSPIPSADPPQVLLSQGGKMMLVDVTGY